MNEIFIYEEILPRIELEVPHFYGSTEDDEGYSWLFLEDLGTRAYSEENYNDRLLVADWLARFHSLSSALPLSNQLEAHSAEVYLADLQTARNRIRENLANPFLSGDDRGILSAILEDLNTTEAGWNRIEEVCTEMPSCMVHGDFISKNTRLARGSLFVMDWEYAGWGIPSVDLGALDITIENFGLYELEVYREGSPIWSGLSMATLQMWRLVGLVFRYLAWISATAVGLAHEWVEGTMNDLALYERSLRKVISGGVLK